MTLDAVGEYVEFTLTAPANAMSFRYSLPDSADGTGRDATIDVRVGNGAPKSVPVTSKYGWYYGGYPFNNNPGDTNPHHFYDETRTMFGSTLPAGTKVRLQVTSTAAVADASPSTWPTSSRSARRSASRPNALDVVTDFGADPTGAHRLHRPSSRRPSTPARPRARAVYIPQGNFTLCDHVVVDRVTLRGAGPWYRVLGGRHPTQRNRAVGVYGKYVRRHGRPQPQRTSPSRTSPSSATSGSGWTTTRSTPSAAR